MKQKITGAVFCCCLFFLACFFFGCNRISKEKNHRIENLRIFAKLFGYVRYFHPSDEASKIDWNRFAIKGVRKVKDIRNQGKFLQALKSLFYPIAPTMQIYNPNENPDREYPEKVNKKSEYSVVAWQHKGVGQSTAQSVYWSIRLNRESKFRIQGYGFGGTMQFIDAWPFRGAEIKLSAVVKMDVHGFGNQGQLWLRVDRENQKIGFFNNMDDSPIFSPSWKRYEITGKVNSDANRVAFGGFLRGEGKMWLDDFKLAIRKQKKRWMELEIKNNGFEFGKIGQVPQFWIAKSPGYIYEITDSDPFIGKKCLLIKNEYNVFRGKLFDNYPKVGEIIEENLGRHLSCRIPLALWSDKNGTVGDNKKYPFKPLAKILNDMNINSLTAENENLRLANIIITWNVFQHFYPYFEEIKNNWDKVLTQTLIESLTDKNEYDFLLTLRKMLVMLKDGHGNVYHRCVQNHVRLPFKVDWIENRIVVVKSIDQRIQKGDIILAIDGIDAITYLREKEHYISGSPQFKRYRAMLEFGMGENGTAVRIEALRGKKRFVKSVDRNNNKILDEFENPSFKRYQGNICYVNLKRASMAIINSNMNNLAGAKGIIFDLRGYPNKNHGVLSHLIKSKDTSQAWMRIPLYIYPDQKNIAGYHKMGWELAPKKPRIKGKIIFLIDSSAISYSESFLSFVEHYRLGELLGQPTAGANGNVNVFFLPGGYSVSWTGMKVVKHDGSQHHLIGIRPTIWMDRTIEGVKQNRDEFLEKALEIITK